MNPEEVDPCVTCGMPNVIDGTNPTAHWDTPNGTDIVAWTCSDECADALEQRRGADGVLVWPQEASVQEFEVYCFCKPPDLDENDVCRRCGTAWKETA